MPEQFDFFVVQQEETQLFLIGYDAQTHQMTWGPDMDYAYWSTKSSKVSNFIANQNIPNAAAAGKNGDHPSQRPPL